LSSKKIFRKKFAKEFLPPVEKHALSPIFQMYGLPTINENRTITVSPFQFIPVIELSIMFVLFTFFKKFLNNIY
jgi:hypothetical protein